MLEEKIELLITAVEKLTEVMANVPAAPAKAKRKTAAEKKAEKEAAEAATAEEAETPAAEEDDDDLFGDDEKPVTEEDLRKAAKVLVVELSNGDQTEAKKLIAKHGGKKGEEIRINHVDPEKFKDLLADFNAAIAAKK